MLTLKNRTDQQLNGTWNGRQYELEPYGTEAFPVEVARAFKRQNPVMGSGDPRDSEAGMTGKMVYKVGITEENDPCDALTDIKEGAERWDRRKLIGARPSDVVAGDNGIYSVRDVSSRLALDPTIMDKA